VTLTRFHFTDRARPLMQIGLGSTDMGFGVGLWDVSFWDAPDATWNGDEPLWRDLSCYGISAHIETGRARITDSFDIGVAEVIVDNSDGWADPSTDFEVDSVPGYIQFDGLGGNLTIPDSADLSFAGDFTLIIRLYVTAAPSVGSAPFMIKGVDPDLAYQMYYYANSDINIDVSDDGTIADSSAFTTAGQPRSVGAWRWFAFAFDASNGGNHHGTWWYGGAEDNYGAWQLIETAIWPGVMTIHNSAADLVLGSGMNGRIGHFELSQGNGGMTDDDVNPGGSLVFKLDGWNLSAFDVGASTLTAATGQTITVTPTGSSVPVVVPAVNPAGAVLLAMRPGRPIRIGVDHDTMGTRWRFNGFIDEILPTDDPEDWSKVTFKCIDALGEAGRAKLRTNEETGAGELTKGRFARILDLISWAPTKRRVSASAIRALYAAEMDGQVVDLLRQTAESEGGWAFGDDQGRVVLQHRDWLYHEVGAAVDGIIGNFGVEGSELAMESGDEILLEQDDEIWLEDSSDEVCPGVWERSFARRDMTTEVILDRDFPSTVDLDEEPGVYVARDRPAQVLYGIEPYERLDLWTLNHADLQVIAGRILATRKAAISLPRISAVHISAEAATVDKTELTVDLLSTLSIFTPSRYRCRLRTDRGTVFDANFFAVGVREDISAEAWTAQIALDLAAPFEVLGASEDWIWDTGRWDRALWN
jgi:hypothetical protein